MATVSLWAGVGVAVQSALIAADTITGITKANPAVVSSTAHGIANGAYVLLSVQGMHQINNRVFRVANQAANTFELEGEDSTLYDTFVSGTASEITFGTTVTTVTGVTVSGGEFEKEDITTIHDSTRSQIPTVASPTVFSMESIWDASDVALKALAAATAVRATRAVRITFSNGQKFLFNGYPGINLAPGGTAQGKVTTPLSFDAAARGTFYAT
jgi:hypothetical protein